MSSVFLTNPAKMCLRFNTSSLPSISLNNTEIGTLINIYPSTQTAPLRSVDLSSTIAAQAFYHLLDLQNHQTIDREIKRSTNSPRKRTIMTSKQRFNFAKLADEVIKNKEEISNSSSSLDASSSSTPSSQSVPAAITSGISLLASTTYP
jgi:hypothetical protein